MEETATEANRPNTLVGKRPKTGIPSEDQLYLPRKDTLDELLKKQGAIRSSTTWDASDLLQFVFPQRYRSAYHGVAVSFLTTLQQNNGSLTSSQIGEFVQKTKISKATFYNKVLPRLVRIGMLDRNREPTSNKMTVKWSNQFAIYLEKIAFEWKRLEPR